MASAEHSQRGLEPEPGAQAAGLDDESAPRGQVRPPAPALAATPALAPAGNGGAIGAGPAAGPAATVAPSNGDPQFTPSSQLADRLRLLGSPEPLPPRPTDSRAAASLSEAQCFGLARRYILCRYDSKAQLAADYELSLASLENFLRSDYMLAIMDRFLTQLDERDYAMRESLRYAGLRAVQNVVDEVEKGDITESHYVIDRLMPPKRDININANVQASAHAQIEVLGNILHGIAGLRSQFSKQAATATINPLPFIQRGEEGLSPVADPPRLPRGDDTTVPDAEIREFTPNSTPDFEREDTGGTPDSFYED